MIVYDREVSLDEPAYFVVLTFVGDKVSSIHGFLYARYAMGAVSIQGVDEGRCEGSFQRYCARMVGSLVDGEDVVQETMLKAHLAWASIDRIDNPEGWLFRIAHNAALDFVRRRLRMPELLMEEELAMIAAPMAPDLDIDGAPDAT
jgi:hypothetical protein